MTKGDKCINLHIPSGAPLLERDCIMSLKRMSEFSAEFHPDYDFRAFVCYSWLLDPQFQELLKPESNIVRFQNRFTLVSTSPAVPDFPGIPTSGKITRWWPITL